MKNYRKAKKGEVTCEECASSRSRGFSLMIECMESRLVDGHRHPVVGRQHTCDLGKYHGNNYRKAKASEVGCENCRHSYFPKPTLPLRCRKKKDSVVGRRHRCDLAELPAREQRMKERLFKNG